MGPVVQSIVNWIKSLVEDLLSLTDSQNKCYNFFAGKMLGAIVLQKRLTFFCQKRAAFLGKYVWAFHISLTNTSLVLNN